MATTLFPTNAASSQTSNQWASTGVKKVLGFTRGSGATTATDNTISSLATIPISGGGLYQQAGAGATSSSQIGSGGNLTLIATSLVWITEPLNAVTVAGTITVNSRAFESAAAANYGAHAVVGYIKVSPLRNNVVFGFGGNTTELGTAEAATSISITPTSTALAAGDMLYVVLGYASAGGTSSSGRTASVVYAGTAGGASGDTFVTFTETITVQATAAIPDVGMALTVT
jgi:hypothetical protein